MPCGRRARNDSLALGFSEAIGDCHVEGAIDLDHVREERRVVRGLSVGALSRSRRSLDAGRSAAAAVLRIMVQLRMLVLQYNQRVRPSYRVEQGGVTAACSA